MYNRTLPLMGYEELNVPAITEIETLQDVLVKDRLKPKNAYQSSTYKFMMLKNLDLEELSITKDSTDFDKNFLRYLKVSVEQERRLSKCMNMREKLDDIV